MSNQPSSALDLRLGFGGWHGPEFQHVLASNLQVCPARTGAAFFEEFIVVAFLPLLVAAEEMAIDVRFRFCQDAAEGSKHWPRHGDGGERSRRKRIADIVFATPDN